MPRLKLVVFTLISLAGFAGNSLLCRIALKETGIDAASFTAIRLASGALALWLIVLWRGRGRTGAAPDWRGAAALLAYAVCFSFAYRSLSAGTGALLLFGAVQASMILYGLWSGERLDARRGLGLALAIAGLVGLVLPGLSAPPPLESALMIAAGIAWGAYSLVGRTAGEPLAATAANFRRAAPFAVALSLALLPWAGADRAGVLYAALSGAVTSGMVYAVWYTALPSLRATTAATVQLSVPVIAALGGVAFLGETITWRLMLASLAVLGGIALVIAPRRQIQAAD